MRVNFPWESRHVLRTECWTPGEVSFAAVTVLVVEIHNTLWKVCVVWNEAKGGVC